MSETLPVPWSLSANPFAGKSKGGACLAVAKVLVLDALFLEVRSRSGNGVPIVPVNPHQANVILYSNKKGRGLKAQWPHSKIKIVAEETNITVPSRSASQAHLALRLLRRPKWQGPGPTDCSLCRLPLPLIPRGNEGGQVLHCLKAWAKPCGCPWWGLWSPAGHSPQPVLWSS